jgi:thermitase
MKFNQFILHFLALMFCACLPMTPVMFAAVESAPSGYIAEVGNSSLASGISDLPMLSHDSLRWDLIKIGAPSAWLVVSGGSDVLIAVLDTGIDDTNTSLKAKVTDRVNFSNSQGLDVRGHGTFIASLIASSLENSASPGLAYNARLLDVKVAEDDGSTDAKKVAEGIVWAVDHGAQVINISIVINQSYPPLEQAIEYAWQNGCVIVAAAGNQASSVPVYPAAYDHVIAVAASDKTDSLASWSNRGKWVDVEAPGVSIYSMLPGNCYAFKNGSSFSSALVSGEAALLINKSMDVDQDGTVNDEVTSLIENNCDFAADENSKRIDVYDAARAADILLGIIKATDTD